MYVSISIHIYYDSSGQSDNFLPLTNDCHYQRCGVPAPNTCLTNQEQMSVQTLHPLFCSIR